jgi:hypothetical protein
MRSDEVADRSDARFSPVNSSIARRQLRQARGAIGGLTIAIGLSVGANLAVFTQV